MIKETFSAMISDASSSQTTAGEHALVAPAQMRVTYQ